MCPLRLLRALCGKNNPKEHNSLHKVRKELFLDIAIVKKESTVKIETRKNKKTPSEVRLQKGFWLFYQSTIFVVEVIFEIRIRIAGLNFYPFFVLQKPFGSNTWESFC